MVTKKDLIRENSNIAKDLKKANKTILNLRKEMKGMTKIAEPGTEQSEPKRVSIAQAIIDGERNDSQNARISTLLEELSDTRSTKDVFAGIVDRTTKGRAIFLSMPWYRRNFLGRLRIRKILLGVE